MGRLFPLRFQIVRKLPLISALFLSSFFCQNLWAIQDALVVSERAVIYADEQMSAPVGFIRKGKKIKVGDISRNRAQVYPIIVSGKIAYIRVIDVTTQTESVDSTRLVAERFQKGTIQEYKSNYSLSFFNYSTQISLDKPNDKLKDNDPVTWYGAGIRGGVQYTPRWDLDLMLNVLNGKAERETFRMVEFGVGMAARIIDQNRFQLRLLFQGLIVPFASYAVGDVFRVNGYGFTTGAGLSATYRMGKSWGLEAFGGVYYTKLSGFNPPDPYHEIAPSFVGNRLGLALNYQF